MGAARRPKSAGGSRPPGGSSHTPTTAASFSSSVPASLVGSVAPGSVAPGSSILSSRISEAISARMAEAISAPRAPRAPSPGCSLGSGQSRSRSEAHPRGTFSRAQRWESAGWGAESCNKDASFGGMSQSRMLGPGSMPWEAGANPTLLQGFDPPSRSAPSNSAQKDGKPLHVTPSKCSGCLSSQYNEGRGGTLTYGGKNCSIPAELVEVMRGIWRRTAKTGARFLCVFEVCHNCQDHQWTVRHDPNVYQRYVDDVTKWIKSTYSFVQFEQLHLHEHFIARGSRPRRIGAFEVYFLCPSHSPRVPSHFLLHSKLMTRRWPNRKQLLPCVKTAMPEIVPRLLALHETLESGSADWSQDGACAAVASARSCGLGKWILVEEISARVTAVADCLEQGRGASEAKDLTTLRETMQHGIDLQLPEEKITEWRGELKKKNMGFFNVMSQVRRFGQNVAFAVAVRGLRSAVVRPLRVDVLQKAVERADAAKIPEEDYEDCVELLSQCSDVSHLLEMSREGCDLRGIVEGLAAASALDLRGEAVDLARSDILELASRAQRALLVHDYVELVKLLGNWTIPPDDSLGGGDWTSEDLSTILAAERERERLKALVDEAEKRFAAGRWDALQSSVDRLRDIHVDETTWEQWLSALKRERNFTVMKAISGAGAKLKRSLYTSRLEAALRTPTAIDKLEELASDAESHRVDENVVARVRAEITTVRQRCLQAEQAVKQGRVDTAEVMIWKLKRGKIQVELATRRDGPMWAMADQVRSADAAKDWEAMQRAVQGWSEDKPGGAHEAFEQEGSATAAFRFATKRIQDLQVLELSEQLDAAIDVLGQQVKASAAREAAVSEVQRIVKLIREMLSMGWQMAAATRARLLVLLTIANVENLDAGAARFGAAGLRTLGSSARVVFVLEQSYTMMTKTMKGEEAFNQYLKKAVTSISQEINKHSQGLQWGAVAHGPVEEIAALTPDFERFTEALERHPFGAGSKLTAKAMKKALDLFKLKLGQQPQDDKDALRIVFNFTVGQPKNLESAEKGFRLLEAQGVVVVGVGIGPGIEEQDLQVFSSPGLAFVVQDFSQLGSFVDDALVEMRRVLDEAQAASTEDILSKLASFV